MIKSLSLGRYTLTEAVEVFLAHQPKFDREALIGDLKWLVNQKKIFAYHPGHAKSPNSISSDGSGEFYWEDLNAIWLPHFENQKWCFAKPIAKLKPDWAYWRLMKHVELEAAIYLSLNVNPYWKVFTEHLDRDTLVQYQARITQVISWIEGAEWVVGSVKSKSFIESTKISLESFAGWFGEEMGRLERPLEFDALANLSGGAEDDCGVPASLDGMAPVDETARSRPSWALKPLSEIRRMPNYRAVVYQTLKKMHEEGKQNAPTAYEVLESWRNEFKYEQPKECKIWVLKATFEFENKEGKRSTVQVKSLNETIQRLLIT